MCVVFSYHHIVLVLYSGILNVLICDHLAMSQQEECQSTPALIQTTERLDVETGEPSSSLSSIPENNLLESYTRLSISLEDNGLFKVWKKFEILYGARHLFLDYFHPLCNPFNISYLFRCTRDNRLE